ncbi:MAG: cation:proton antiporter, partial [Acutalibacteraceae bacterium]|jgi:Kef-type K+ transport system membrane component KefB
VETMLAMGTLHTRVGNTVLAAAIIDDVLGLVALTIVTGFAGEDVNVALVLLKIVLFFIFVICVGFVAVKAFNWYTAKRAKTPYLHRYPIAAFVLCLMLAFLAEYVFGVADIIGAFAAGLIVASTTKGNYISSKFQSVQYLFLTPIFFANIGLKVTLPSMNWMIVLFAACMVITAIGSKIIGCGLGGRLSGFSNEESLQIGVGMACRGEVALIVANKGLSIGLLPETFFGPVIVTVVCCAVFTPILLKLSFRKRQKNDYSDLQESALADRVEEHAQLDIITDSLLTQNRELQEKK